MSQREAARHFSISRESVAKMMAFSVPPGYRRSAPVKQPKLDGFAGIIDGWLDSDREVHRKQRHTAKRVFERLRDGEPCRAVAHRARTDGATMGNSERQWRRRTAMPASCVPIRRPLPRHGLMATFTLSRSSARCPRRSSTKVMRIRERSEGSFPRRTAVWLRRFFLMERVSAPHSSSRVPAALYQRPYELTALAYSRSLIERTRS
ncbi:hypothetical protein ABIE58_004009 [Roseovarius sp. MBR-78]